MHKLYEYTLFLKRNHKEQQNHNFTASNLHSVTGALQSVCNCLAVSLAS